jgi:2-succinyl-6-hydroxy-2,4-cyclohexadiene-1-carboxylate synthase
MSRIHALHGFLGHHSDWNYLSIPGIQPHNLFDEAIRPGADGFWGWARRFNDYVSSDGDVILGYSLGGRLAMHALLNKPVKWKAAIIISSHTGLQSEDAKKARIADDHKWAERFENDPWHEVMADWGKQAVFGGIPHPLPRPESHFSRKEQAHLLRSCSRGYQDDLTDLLQNVNVPIHWICGELDLQAKELKFNHQKSRVNMIPGAAHRVPWEQPKLFTASINQFIKEVT